MKKDMVKNTIRFLAFIFFALATVFVGLMIVGAFRCINCYFTGAIPSDIEWIAFTVVTFICGFTGLILYIVYGED